MDLRLGNLLSHFNLLEESEVERALGVANETGLPVGKVLVMLERILWIRLRQPWNSLSAMAGTSATLW